MVILSLYLLEKEKNSYHHCNLHRKNLNDLIAANMISELNCLSSVVKRVGLFGGWGK